MGRRPPSVRSISTPLRTFALGLWVPSSPQLPDGFLELGDAFTRLCRDEDWILARLPLVAMVTAAQDVDLNAEPEEGKAGEAAVALDSLNDTRKKAEATEKTRGREAMGRPIELADRWPPQTPPTLATREAESRGGSLRASRRRSRHCSTSI